MKGEPGKPPRTISPQQHKKRTFIRLGFDLPFKRTRYGIGRLARHDTNTTQSSRHSSHNSLPLRLSFFSPSTTQLAFPQPTITIIIIQSYIYNCIPIVYHLRQSKLLVDHFFVQESFTLSTSRRICNCKIQSISNILDFIIER